MLTLPYIYMLESVNSNERKKILSKLKYNVKVKDISSLKRMIVNYGGIDYAENKINELSDNAIGILYKFPDSNYKDSLIQIVEFNKKRKF